MKRGAEKSPKRTWTGGFGGQKTDSGLGLRNLKTRVGIQKIGRDLGLLRQEKEKKEIGFKGRVVISVEIYRRIQLIGVAYPSMRSDRGGRGRFAYHV
jgi:hypothetical protein